MENIRGFTFSARVSGQFEHKMLQAARGIFDPLLHNVHIYTDHKAGKQAGMYVLPPTFFKVELNKILLPSLSFSLFIGHQVMGFL